MNHIHRLVWNEQTGSWVAVSETARSRGKGGARSARKAFMAALIASGFAMAPALAELPATTVVPASGKTNAYISANGVPVVNIETANAKGLSHNFYTTYNVETSGLVLNNGNNSQVSRQSQLAGQVVANLNLVQEAKVILNEVVSTNRSALAGFTEVLGGRADVIVANPNGITCNGCGFINTDRVTLTTGTANVAIDGSLTGFNVNRGDLLIEGLGANASIQQIFDLVARSVKLDGKVNVPATHSLGITTGNNVWSYAGRNVTGSVAGSGAAPTYAFDSTVLGGMYAGRINIIASEAGVGVRMLGEAAASADDFTLSSAGQVEIQSSLSAARDVSLASSSVTGSDDLFLNGAGAKVSAGRDVSLGATAGQVRLVEAELFATRNLSISGASLSDVATDVSNVATDAKTRFAGGNASLVTSGAAVIDGSVWGAGSALSGAFGSLAIGTTGATLYAGSTLGLSTVGDMSLATAAVRSTDDMTLAASAGAISVSAGAEQGIQTTAGNLSLSAGNGLSNDGTLTADAGSVTARINGLLNNRGTLHAKTSLDVADQSGGTSENVTNSGTLIADGALTAKAASFTNLASGTVQGTTGTTLTATTLTNAGTFIASSTAGQSGTFNLASLINSGTLQSAQDLTFNASAALTNSGKLLASHDLSVLAGSAALAISNTYVDANQPGVIQAGNALTMTGANATFDTQSGTVLANTVALTLDSLNNAGTLQSNADMTYAVDNGVSNSGTLLAKTTLTGASGSLNNTGTLQANLGSTITTTGALTNSGSLIASDSASQGATLNVGTLSNTGSGVIQSAQNLALNVSGSSLTNAGTVIASDDLTLNSTGSGLTVTNQSGGYLQAGSATGDTLTVGGPAVVLNNNAGAFILGNQLAMNLVSLTNAGTLQGGTASSTLTASGTVTNSGTLNLATTSAGSGTITADALTNSGTLQSQGTASINVATQLSNSGSLLTAGAMTVRGTDGAYTVSQTGRMQSGGLMSVKGQGGGNGVDITVGSSGVMLGDSMDVNAGTLAINNGGMVSSTGAMDLVLSSLVFGGATSRIVAANSGTGNASVSLANSFSNIGAVHSGGNLTFAAPAITNTSTGGFSALNNLTFTATGGDISNAGALYAGNLLTASTPGTFTNAASTGTIDSGLDISITANEFVNYNNVTAGRNITFNAGTFRNEVVGGDTRAWGGITWGADTNSSTDDYYDFPDDYRVEYWNKVGVANQYFVGGAPTYKPQILAANTLAITGFNVGYNTGGILSGQTVTLTGNGGGAVFTNNDLALNRQEWKRTWERYTHWIALGPAKYDDRVFRNDSGDFKTAEYNVSSIGAGIFATAGINGAGFALVNAGATKAASSTVRSATGASGTGLGNAVGETTTGSGVSGVTASNGQPAISFGGLVITLPTNPNGYFVISQNPGANYLVETNPLFNVGSNFVGSDYMARRYGYNPDTLIKRLGDSNYEAYLIRQQLVSQTGSNLLAGYGNEADQMKRLMDQAVVEGKRTGFSFGQALTSDQIANLKDDVVWMVETTVAGQKVLAPVVYLAASTRNAIEAGAVIAAKDVNLDLTALTNTGGTISGAKSLTITSQGDITNTSGTIKGGDVSLTSVSGSIINRTDVEGDGSKEEYNTIIGKTGGIIATGDLDLKAQADIKVIGANVSAGGNASLDAGKNITFDTIVDKTTSTTRSSVDAGLLYNSRTTTTTTTENNVGSNLTTGGNLTLKSGGDTTIAGSKATVGGDLNVDAGGSFNVLARQDKTTTKSESTTSGLGVGGGLAGTEKTTVDSFKGTNSGSTLTVGGNATVKAEKEMTVQGSDVKIAGDADINAKQGINILDGLNEERTTTRTETTTFLKVESAGEKGSSSGANSGSKSGAGNASASANAQANAEASGTSDLKLAETTVSTTQAGSNTSVSSNFTVGGNLTAKTEGTLKVQGSNVEAGGDMALDAKNVEVLTGRNEEWSNNQTTRTSVGIYNEGEASANAQAQAQAKAGTAGTDASASAGANAEAGGTTTIGARTENEESTAYKLTNSSSTLKSGGNLSIKAKEDAKFVGANVESGGDMTIEAKNISNLAAQDIETNTSTKTTQTAGFYIDGKVSAEAKAEADAGKINIGGMPANAEASAEAKADVSAGVRYKNEQESSSDGSVTQVTSSFKAGGNLMRNATDTITDQGTQIEAGGNINQKAREIKEIEANNSSYSTSDSSSHDAKIGVGASASAEAGANSKGEAEADAGAGAGFRAKYAGSIESESESSSTAVTSKYKAGGNVNSTSTEKTTLIGTTFETGGDVNINAGSLDFKAAKDTSSKQSSTNEINAELKVDVVGKAGGSLAADYANTGDSEKSSTARTGSINAGGNLNIKTTGDTTLEGAQLEAGGKASIAAGGTVDFKAARDTSESKSTAIDASLELSTSKGAKGVEASAGYSQEDSSSSKAQTGSIKAGSGGISVSAGKDANFEGTTLKSDGDTAIGAGGNVNLKAAKNTETTTSFGVEASLGAEKGDEGSKKSGSVGGSAAYANSVDSDKTSIQSGGTVMIKGNNVVNQEAAITGKDGTSIVGNEVKTRAEKSDVSIGLEVKVSSEKETKNAE